jgi:hypothetical protein
VLGKLLIALRTKNKGKRIIAFEWVTRRLLLAVRLEGANHQWRKIPSGELSIDLEADERLGRVPDITTL